MEKGFLYVMEVLNLVVSCVLAFLLPLCGLLVAPYAEEILRGTVWAAPDFVYRNIELLVVLGSILAAVRCLPNSRSFGAVFGFLRKREEANRRLGQVTL